MADYICKHCKFNNNGWCVALKKNKLSETIECDSFKSGKYGEFKDKKIDEIIKTDSKIGKWYRVISSESFYEDMVGKVVDETDKTYRLYFSNGIGTAIFYKNQVQFEGEF